MQCTVELYHEAARRMGIIPDGSRYRKEWRSSPTQLIVLSKGAVREDGAAVLPPKINKAAAVKIGSSLVDYKLMRDHALVLASAGTDAMTRLAEQQSEGAHVERDKNEPPSHDGRLGVVPVLIDADESNVPRAGTNP